MFLLFIRVEVDLYSMDVEGLLLPLVYMICVGVLSIIIVLLLDTKIILRCWYAICESLSSYSPVPISPETYVDDDVFSERDFAVPMAKMEMQNYSLVAKDLSKMYGKFCSVNRLSFVVET